MSLKSKMAVAAATVFAPAAMFAQETAATPIVDSVTIPTMFEWQDIIDTLLANIGPVIGYCIAGTLAVVVVRWGLRWARGIGR